MRKVGWCRIRRLIPLSATGLALVGLALTQTWRVHAQQPARGIAAGGERVDPVDLPDGRIVYTRVLPAAGSGAATALFVAQADGREEHRITFGEARDRAPALLPDGRIVFRRHALGAGRVGKLFAINPDGTGLQLFSEPADGASVEGGPWLKDGRVLFSEDMPRGTGEQLVSVSPRQPFGEREILAGNGSHADAARVSFATFGKLLQPSPGVAPRAKPLSLTSVVDERKSTGTLLCLDARTSRVSGLAGANGAAIRSVRVLEADGKLLGETPVETDGSFFIEVPADRPLNLELIGADGVLAADHSGFWVRPNENRGCIGCHEDPELAPENTVVLAVARGGKPAGMAAQIVPADVK